MRPSRLNPDLWLNKPSRDPNSPGSADFSAELLGLFGQKHPSNDLPEVHQTAPFEKCIKDLVSDPRLVDSGPFTDGPTTCHMVRSYQLSHGWISPPLAWSDLATCHMVRSHHMSQGLIRPSIAWSDLTICHMVRSDHVTDGQICPCDRWSGLTMWQMVRSDHVADGQILRQLSWFDQVWI